VRRSDNESETTVTDGQQNERLKEMLMRGASGMYIHEAAIGLLIKHGFWLTNPTFLEHIVVELDGTVAGIDYKNLMSVVDKTGGGADEESISILRIAASLSGMYPVHLRDVVEGISRENIRYVAESIMYADGFLTSTATPGY
jgi:hypothetical protein